MQSATSWPGRSAESRVAVPEEEQDRRLAICYTCEFWDSSGPMLKVRVLRGMEDVAGHTEMPDRQVVNPARRSESPGGGP